ncbi:MAG: cytidine deaminase [Treponema sp.]|jgi:cytidine deaminase|nr:cytidine deaminase [Treponema sp.]
MNEISMDDLFREAKDAALKAYAPYSRFRVGAALLTEDGSVITGCNVENVSFGLTICAERSAVVRAVSMGYRAFRAAAIAGLDSKTPVAPCGACRQVLAEFMTPAAPVRFGSSGPALVDTTIGDLLPSNNPLELPE